MEGGSWDEENKIYRRWGHANDTKKFVLVGNIILRVCVSIYCANLSPHVRGTRLSTTWRTIDSAVVQTENSVN